MKLFCVVLVIYVLALTLYGVDGRGGGTRNGLEKSMGNYFRARRHAIGETALEGTQYGNEKPPPPPPHFRTRRNVVNTEDHGPPHGANDTPHMRNRRQMPPGPPPPPEGMPPPPEGMPPPPS
ncbi:acrosin isoform X1 [Drosophila albomicans]|uniref:Acrosin isoform X1 n=1 Tax=Drosophila albomicans TaxID=7291 RepID=A0A6P8YML5_DROAB|nr:acrosin isoform X1 [Drosophila albomicans]